MGTPDRYRPGFLRAATAEVGAHFSTEDRVWFLWLFAASRFVLGGPVSVFSLLQPAEPASMASAADSALLRTVVGTVLTFALWTGLALTAYCYAQARLQMRAAETGNRLRDGERRVVGGFIGTAAVYVGLCVVVWRVTDPLLHAAGVQQRSYPWDRFDHQSVAVLWTLTSSVGAGVQEELLLLALPVALLRRRGWNWWPVFGVVFALRFAMHLYYGWGSLAAAPWVVGGFLLYRAAGTIWPLVIGHAMYDTLTNVDHFWTERATSAMTAFMWLAGLIVCASLVRRVRT